jgi:hypothetical protein
MERAPRREQRRDSDCGVRGSGTDRDGDGRPHRRGDPDHGDLSGPAVFLAAFLWTAEAQERGGDSGSSRTRRSGTYQAPVDHAPEVLCGCTEVLKNFA